MIKYLIFGLGFLYASKAYAARLKAANDKAKAAATVKQNSLNSVEE
jgi:hypothetical protein